MQGGGKIKGAERLRPVFRRRLLAAAWSSLLLFSIATACGGTSTPGSPSLNDASGGVGGASENPGGSAVPGTCTPGDTRQCVGPAACRGGQVCESETWSACDCGSSAGGDAPQGFGGVGGSEPAATGGAGAAAAGGDSGGAPAELADACPSPNANDQLPPWNCADDCFKQRVIDREICSSPKLCTNADASGFGGIIDLPKAINAGDILLRTPSASRVGGPCACNKGVAIAAKLLFDAVPDDAWPYQASSGTAYHIHVTVRLPWHVGLVADAVDCAPPNPAQCQDLGFVNVKGGNSSNLQIWTEDLAAPPVNAEMAPGECP